MTLRQSEVFPSHNATIFGASTHLELVIAVRTSKVSATAIRRSPVDCDGCGLLAYGYPAFVRLAHPLPLTYSTNLV